MTAADDVTADLVRQLAHWVGAASTFQDAEEFASLEAWRSVEADVDIPLRRELARSVEALQRAGRAATAEVRATEGNPTAIPRALRAVQAFRRQYTAVEMTLDFLGDAVNTRSSPSLRTALQRLDFLAAQSLQPLVVTLGLPQVPVLSYVDRGMGASILRAGVRLWSPGTINPVAAIKIVRHNLYRPTSLFHEVGHQAAHLTNWGADVGRAIGAVLTDDPPLAEMWRPWTSEIVADVFAFVHTGYASVAALYDVVGDDRSILRWPLGDPHPIGWIRTLLGCAMCRSTYGPGPWDAFERAVVVAHPLKATDARVASLLERSRGRLDGIVHACLATPIRGFRDRTIGQLVNPQRVSPDALSDLERQGGAALWTSPHWRRTEGIRLVALAGLREAENPQRAGEWIERSRRWLAEPARAA